MKRLLLPVLTALSIAVMPNAVKADTTLPVTGGGTAVALSSTFTGALTDLGIAFAVNHPGTLNNDTAAFPAVEGAIDLNTAAGEIVHSGGLTFTAGSTTVTFLNFIIDTSATQPVLTAEVVVDGAYTGRINLFDLGLPALTLPLKPTSKSTIEITKISVTLTKGAAAAFNSAFATKAFSGGLNVGTATTDVGVIQGK